MVVKINRILSKMYADDKLLDDSAIHRWRREFLAGHSPLEDEERSGRPHKSVTVEKIKHIWHLILEDSHLS